MANWIPRELRLNTRPPEDTSVLWRSLLPLVRREEIDRRIELGIFPGMIILFSEFNSNIRSNTYMIN